MKYKAVLFDMDGTLLDTLSDMHDAVNHILALHGWPQRSREEVRAFVGNGARKLMERAVPVEVAASPAFATIFGAVLLREEITPLGLVGILLILGSLLLPYFIKGKKCHDEVQSSSV